MRPLIFICALFTVVILAEQSSGVNYMWLTDNELGPNNDVMRFWGNDVMDGPVRTNGCFAVQNVRGLPIFMDSVFMGCPVWLGDPPDTWIPPLFGADSVHFPDSALSIREQAAQEDNYYDFLALGHQARAVINWSTLLLYHWPDSLSFDDTQAEFVTINLLDQPTVFVEGKVETHGIMNPLGCSLILGASEDFRILDDLMLEGTDDSTGALPEGATSRIVLVSEQNVVVANTWANGRENCVQGCDIVVTALIFALSGSWTFEEQNDIGNEYISPVSPDERGKCVFTGGVTQRNRGYMHRSNLGGTGYGKVSHYDPRLRYWDLGIIPEQSPVDNDPILAPSSFSLSAFPNPFNALTTISFNLPREGNVKLTLFDVTGRNVATLLDNKMNAGTHTLNYSAASLASGVYFARLESAAASNSIKLLLIK